MQQLFPLGVTPIFNYKPAQGKWNAITSFLKVFKIKQNILSDFKQKLFPLSDTPIFNKIIICSW